MTAPAALSFDDVGMRAHVSSTDDKVVVNLGGNAELPASQRLDELLKEVHALAVASRVKEVAVDLRELEFMNSSCFKCFVTWINSVQELPSSQQYMIRLISNPDRLWQRRSMHALKCFATELIVVEI